MIDYISIGGFIDNQINYRSRYGAKVWAYYLLKWHSDYDSLSREDSNVTVGVL